MRPHDRGCETGARPRWRLRWRYFERLVSHTILWLVLLPVFRAMRHMAVSEQLLNLLVSWGMLAATIVVLAVRERRRRPAVLRMWDDGSPYRLVVRRQRSGEVLLRSEQDTLAGQDLRGVRWAMADLMDVNLKGADLREADLRSADLRKAYLKGTDLRGTNLAGARLAGARVAGATLEGADLRGADFLGRGAGRVFWDHDLREADLRGAYYNAATRWPTGFYPAECGCILLDDDTLQLPIPHGVVSEGSSALPLPSERTSLRR